MSILICWEKRLLVTFWQQFNNTTPYLMEKYAQKAQYKLKSVTEQFC